MRRTIPLALLLAGLLAPSSALGANAKISPNAAEVSPAGVATVEAANPNAYVLKGKATVTASGRTIATRTVKLARRSVGTITLRFDAKAREALQKSGGRATVTLKLRGSNGKRLTARRTITLTLASNAAEAKEAPAGTTPAESGPAPAAQAPAPAATPAPAPAPAPASNRWAGRMGTEGAYDDLELTSENGQLQITKAPLVAVLCLTVSPAASSVSLELFDAPGPWAVGSDAQVVKKGIAVNQLVGSGEREITYKLTESAKDANRITGKLNMTFSGLKWNYSTSLYVPVTCSGTQSFEAVPAG